MPNPWDAKIANAGTMADHCMKLGAVILKPKDKPKVGFTPPPEPGPPGQPDEPY